MAFSSPCATSGVYKASLFGDLLDGRKKLMKAPQAGSKGLDMNLPALVYNNVTYTIKSNEKSDQLQSRYKGYWHFNARCKKSTKDYAVEYGFPIHKKVHATTKLSSKQSQSNAAFVTGVTVGTYRTEEDRMNVKAHAKLNWRTLNLKSSVVASNMKVGNVAMKVAADAKANLQACSSGDCALVWNAGAVAKFPETKGVLVDVAASFNDKQKLGLHGMAQCKKTTVALDVTPQEKKFALAAGGPVEKLEGSVKVQINQDQKLGLTYMADPVPGVSVTLGTTVPLDTLKDGLAVPQVGVAVAVNVKPKKA